MNDFRKRNKIFPIGFDQNYRSYKIARAESRKNSTGTNDFRQILTTDLNQNIPYRSMSECYSYYNSLPASLLLKASLQEKPWDTEAILINMFLK